MTLDSIIDEVIKEEDDMVQSQQQLGYCVAGILVDKIENKTLTLLSKKELLFIIHEKFKVVVRPITSFTFTRDELEQFLGIEDGFIYTDIYEHLLKGYENSEYKCPICRNPPSG